MKQLLPQVQSRPRADVQRRPGPVIGRGYEVPLPLVSPDRGPEQGSGMGASADNDTDPGLGAPRVGGVKQPGLGGKGRNRNVGIVLGL